MATHSLLPTILALPLAAFLGCPLSGAAQKAPSPPEQLVVEGVIQTASNQGGGGFGAEAPAGMPPSIGLIGTPILSHYDFLVDGPNLRVRLCRPQW